MFAVGRVPVPQAVRVSLAASRDDDEVARGLDVLADLLHNAPQTRRPSM